MGLASPAAGDHAWNVVDAYSRQQCRCCCCREGYFQEQLTDRAQLLVRHDPGRILDGPVPQGNPTPRFMWL